MFHNCWIVQVLPSTLPYDGTFLRNIETVSDAAHKIQALRIRDQRSRESELLLLPDACRKSEGSA
jgi:hypothetical protein